MKPHLILSSAALVCGLLITPALAQPSDSLAYVQPLPPQAVQRVQERLRHNGLYSGAVDGVWGADSAAALQRFQQTHQLQVTGQMNQATAATLGIDPRSLLDMTHAERHEQPMRPSSTLQRSSIRAVQDRLRALGFYQGATDGIWGPGTQGAIERFQQGRGLQPNGQLNPATVSALGLAPEVMIYR
ncbi:MAG: peptidoglycan-binding protein [Acetobacteraceae bacterium]